MRQTKANLMLAVVTVFWGASYLFMKMGLDYVQPFNLIALRFMIAFFLSGIIFYKRLLQINIQTIKNALILGTVLFSVFAFVTVGVQSTSTSHAGFLVSLTVILVPLFSAILLKKKPAKRVVIGVCLAMIGIALLTLKGGFTMKLGDLLCILAAICYATHIIVTGQLTRNDDSVALGVLQLGVCGALGMLVSFLSESPTLPAHREAWFAILSLSVLCSAIGFVVQTVAQKYTTATHAGLIFSLEPVFAALFGYWFLGEILSLKGYVGATFVLAGVLYAEVQMEKQSLNKISIKKI